MKSFVRAGRVEQEIRKLSQASKLRKARAKQELATAERKKNFYAKTGRIAPAGGCTLTHEEEQWVVAHAATVEQETAAKEDATEEECGDDDGGAGASDANDAEAAVCDDDTSSGSHDQSDKTRDAANSNRMFSWLTGVDEHDEGALELDSDAASAAEEIEAAEQKQRKELALAQRDSSVPWFVPYKAHVAHLSPQGEVPGPGPGPGTAQDAQRVSNLSEEEREFVVRRRSGFGFAASPPHALAFNLSESDEEGGSVGSDGELEDAAMREAVALRMRSHRSRLRFKPKLSPRSRMLSRTVKKKMQLFNGRLVTNHERDVAKGLIAEETLNYEKKSVDKFLSARRRYFRRRSKKTRKSATRSFAKFSNDVDMKRRRQASRSEVRRVKSKLRRLEARRIATANEKEKSRRRRRRERARLRRERRAAGDVGVSSSDSSDSNEEPAPQVAARARPTSPLISYQSQQSFNLARSFNSALEYSRRTRRHGSDVRNACAAAMYGDSALSKRERVALRSKCAIKLQSVFRSHMGRMYRIAIAWFDKTDKDLCAKFGPHYLLSRLPRKFLEVTSAELRVKFCSDSIAAMAAFIKLKRKAERGLGELLKAGPNRAASARLAAEFGMARGAVKKVVMNAKGEIVTHANGGGTTTEAPGSTSSATVQSATAKAALALRSWMDENYQRASQLFRELDKDCSGSISRKEFEQGCSSLDIPLGRKDVALAFSAFDRNNDGTLDYGELFTKVRLHNFSTPGR